ncbi:methionine biosynthesis protein MetW [Desulfonatronospira thiodismutans ASO3-1]|uniref:Methionine biosynthesis protein MetW n=1 Tax=Desulfonatronospira thiodismutans ASO3-1 TaxID=555779 RepID=D6SQL3_9BACT|nr:MULTISPECIES: methionine biosynthesis protein MetW [Desulfonatronospira]EFI35039.1 methionine biosynthesis protein MetW [Desulfonatronospira thiodismutans ASO3-1]RQD78203.1 MAG: methionine biosynthesis protein MetW [Desulfonatronospira sp. MSAO_Bac3]
MQASDDKVRFDWKRSLHRDRELDPYIMELAGTGERVLDLGCGRGELLKKLKEEKQVREQGIELNSEHVADCLAQGLSVIQADLEEGLNDFLGDCFDLVILNQVLLTVKNPLALLQQALRIGHRAVVTFPNFAHWRIRLHLLLTGRLPVNQTLPYKWYESPEIRLATIKDFQELCREMQVEIVSRRFLQLNYLVQNRKVNIWPNLRSTVALFCLRQGG